METMRQAKSVKQTVLGYLESKGQVPGSSEEDKLCYQYLENRLIDSFGIIEMVATFEETFGVRFEPHNMQSEDFSTIGGLVKLIESMLDNSIR